MRAIRSAAHGGNLTVSRHEVGTQASGERQVVGVARRQPARAGEQGEVRWRRIVPHDTLAPVRIHQTGGTSLQVARR